MPSEFEVIRASPQDTRRVLRMALASAGMSPADIEMHVTGFMQYARSMKLDLSRQWVAVRGGRIISACTCIESPGRTAMLFLPDSRVSCREPGVIRALVDAAIEDASSRGIRLAQCLLDPDDLETRRAVQQSGFRTIAELVYMELETASARARPGSTASTDCDGITWLTYSTSRHLDFKNLIAETYEGSLDCPGLSGLRDMEDVIAGHKAAGLFDESRWLIACHHGEPAGCILLGENPLRPTLEVVYMAVRPAARGRGLGGVLLQRGLEVAYAAQFEKVTLAVDSMNHPALNLYRRVGFRATLRRTALLRPLDSSTV